MRAHYSAPIQSPAGALQGQTTVSVFAPGSTAGGTQLGTLITGTVYADATSGNAMTNPFIATTGVADFYLAWPQRVDLGVQVPGQAQVFYPAVDVLVPNLVPVVVTASYAVSLSDQLVLASATGGNVSLTLPLATAGVSIHFKRTDSSGNAMSLNAQPGQLIENSASPFPLAALGRARVWSDGTAWWVI
jgi:hypothetical protein